MENNQQEQGLVQATERRMFDLLKDRAKKSYENYFQTSCCGSGISGQIIQNLVLSGINFVFTIVALSTLIKKNTYYLALYVLNCSFNNNILDDLGIFSGLTEPASSFTEFWCGIGNFENGVLISYLLFIIFFIGFEIVSLLIHKKVIKLSFEGEGILYYILVGANILFLVIFYIFVPLLFYLYVYSTIVFITYPDTPNRQSGGGSDFNEENWDKNKAIPIVNSIFVFFIFTFDIALIRVKKTIIIYLSMRYDNENIYTNNEKAKKKTLRINNNNVELEIQANQITYLERVGQSDKIYKFKKIQIQGVTNGFIYLFLNNKAIDDQLSITDWEFPMLNELYLKLEKMASLIYGILFISIPLFKLHLNNEANYILSSNSFSNLFLGINDDNFGFEKPKFYSIYSSYGSFESGTTNSRFALYVVAIFFILLSMGKRIFYGGYTRLIIIIICLVFSAIFILENIIYVLLSFLMILFSIFSAVCFYDMKGVDDMIQAKLYIQMLLNTIIFSICIRLLIDSIQLTAMLNKLRKELNHLNDGSEPEEQEKIKGFQYLGLDNKPHILNEIIFEGHPRYIYYNLYGDINDVPLQPPIQSQPQLQSTKNINNENNNNLPNNSVNIPIVRRINENEIQNSQNIQNIQINNTNISVNDLLTLRNENQTLRDENRRLNDELIKLKKSLGDIYNSLQN